MQIVLMHSKFICMTKTKILIPVLVLIGFTSCTDYGKEAVKGHIETYYKEGITEDQAKRAAEVMYNIDEVAHNAKVKKSFQLCKKNDTVCFRMVVDEEKAKAITDNDFIEMANIISDSVFNGAPVNMDITNNKFETIKSLTYRKIDNRVVVQGHVEIYYKDGITEDQAKKAAEVMYNIDEAANNPKVQKSFQLCKKNDIVCFRMVVADEERAKAIPDISFLAIANSVSDSVFNGAPVDIDLTNNKFESIKYIPYKKVDLNNLENNN